MNQSRNKIQLSIWPYILTKHNINCPEISTMNSSTQIHNLGYPIACHRLFLFLYILTKDSIFPHSVLEQAEPSPFSFSAVSQSFDAILSFVLGWSAAAALYSACVPSFQKGAYGLLQNEDLWLSSRYLSKWGSFHDLPEFCHVRHHQGSASRILQINTTSHN